MTKSEKLCLMRELYEAGSSIKAIAEATGYKENSVMQLLPQAGIVRRHSIKDIGYQVVKMRNEGMSLDQISHKTGFAVKTIGTYLCKIGYNKNRTWEEPVDESNIVFAEPRHEKIERFFINGIRYVTVPLEALYQS